MMRFKIWLENTELLLLNEDYKTAVEKFVRENPQTPRAAIQKYVDEFRTIVTKKYRQINDPIRGLSVPTNKRNNIDAYATFHDLEMLVDYVKGQVDFHGKVNFKDVDVDAKPVFENDSIVIYHADSPRACIKYKGNIPYGWCVSRNDAGNLYHAYRFKDHEPSFYFVKNKQRTQEEFKLWNLVKVSFEGKFKDPYHFFVIQSLKGADPKDHEKKQYVVTSANNEGDKNMSWREIVAIEPKLEGLEEVFKNMPLSAEERADHKEFSGGIDDEKFAKLPYERKSRYMDTYVRMSQGLTDAQFLSLPEDLKNKYIGFGVGLTNVQYDSIKGTKLERRYATVTLEKVKNIGGRTDVPMSLTRSEKAILLANPEKVDLSSISTENIIHLLGGMRRPVKTWADQYGDEHEEEQEDEEWEGDYEEVGASHHVTPENRKEEQQLAELVIAIKKDLDKYDVAALIKHSPDPGKTISALGDKVKMLDDNMIKYVRDYAKNARHEYVKSMLEGLFEKHPELDLNSLSQVLHFAKNPEKTVRDILDRYPNKRLGFLTLQMLQQAKNKDEVLDTLLQRKNVFSGIEPSSIGAFYFGRHHGDFLNQLRGDRRQRLAERLAEDNKESLLKHQPQEYRYGGGHNPIPSLLLMASDKQKILDILGEDILEKINEKDADMVLRLSDPREAEKFASLMGDRLSHKNKISLIVRANDKVKIFDEIGQKFVDEISGADIAMIMNENEMSQESKTLVADEIVKRKREFKHGGVHFYWTYLKHILDNVSDKLRSAMEIVSKIKVKPEEQEWHYIFEHIDLEGQDMQRLVEFTLKNKEMDDWDFNSVFALAPDKQRVIDIVGEERIRKAMRAKSAFNSKSYPSLKDVYEKYK